MKIRIVRKSNVKDISVIDLSKAAMVHYDPITRKLEVYGSVGLEPGSCVQYPEETFVFQTIGEAASGEPCCTNKSALEIVAAYAATV